MARVAIRPHGGRGRAYLHGMGDARLQLTTPLTAGEALAAFQLEYPDKTIIGVAPLDAANTQWYAVFSDDTEFIRTQGLDFVRNPYAGTGWTISHDPLSLPSPTLDDAAYKAAGKTAGMQISYGTQAEADAAETLNPAATAVIQQIGTQLTPVGQAVQQARAANTVPANTSPSPAPNQNNVVTVPAVQQPAAGSSMSSLFSSLSTWEWVAIGVGALFLLGGSSHRR